ncbi:MAG: LPS assembly lipoprotein LptE [Bacteroidota bacterium]
MKRRYSLPLLFLLLLQFSACRYSLRGISIPENVNTFYVSNFDNVADNVVPTLSLQFTQLLRDKIRNESRLNPDDTDPDIEFRGQITNFTVSSVAPQPGETSALNRLEIKIFVEFISNKDESENWKQPFSFFNDFPSDQDILEVQEELINIISAQLVEDVFNRAFTNW